MMAEKAMAIGAAGEAWTFDSESDCARAKRDHRKLQERTEIDR